METEIKKQCIKKLLYKSCNRGCKETDLILGQFAKKHIHEMSDKDLIVFEQILNFSDSDIYDWYTKKTIVPEDKMSNILSKILKFEPSQS